MRTIRKRLVSLVALMVAGPCAGYTAESTTARLPSVIEADAFIAKAEAQLAKSRQTLSRTQWVKQNFITFDTDLLAANATESSNNLVVSLLKQATNFDAYEPTL